MKSIWDPSVAFVEKYLPPTRPETRHAILGKLRAVYAALEAGWEAPRNTQSTMTVKDRLISIMDACYYGHSVVLMGYAATNINAIAVEDPSSCRMKQPTGRLMLVSAGLNIVLKCATVWGSSVAKSAVLLAWSLLQAIILEALFKAPAFKALVLALRGN